MTIPTLQHEQAELPSLKSTKSYWHRQPSEKLLGHRTTAELPITTDVIVVGSGITGAFAARELVGSGRRVVLLEAREACWGATGRNGGHCQPLLYASLPQIARFELDTYTYLKDLVEQNKIPCDWETVGGVHAILAEEVIHLVAKQLERLRRDFPDLAEQVSLVTDKKELAKLRVPDALAAVYQPNAAKLWPYKLVAWVLERLLEKHSADEFNLQTNTPVDHLQRVNKTWVLHTPRGQIAAPNVLLATNAYTSHLLPKLSGLLVPVRGQVCALEPPSDSKPLEHSHVWVTPGGGDDYLVQRPEGALILGGERLSTPGYQVGISRDDVVDPTVGRRLRTALHDAVKLKDPREDEEAKLSAEYEWTGIMCYSRDGHPWVGKVPADLGGEDGGLWVSVGYTGHGMPVAARAGIAASREIIGKEGDMELPSEYRIHGGRAERARNTVLPLTLQDELRAILG